MQLVSRRRHGLVRINNMCRGECLYLLQPLLLPMHPRNRPGNSHAANRSANDHDIYTWLDQYGEQRNTEPYWGQYLRIRLWMRYQWHVQGPRRSSFNLPRWRRWTRTDATLRVEGWIPLEYHVAVAACSTHRDLTISSRG